MSESSSVEVLNFSVQIRQRAIHTLITNWLDDNLKGCQRPSNRMERIKIRLFSSKVNFVDVDLDQVQLVDNCFNQLVELGVPNHFKIVASHRLWIRFIKELLVEAGIKFPEDMDKRLFEHDLDKFSHHTVIGYAIKFGDGEGGKQQFESESEKQAWENAVSYHRKHNDHHPEYFYCQMADGSFDKSTSIMKSSPETLAKSCLIESCLDMLASRGERDLKNDDFFSVRTLFNIDEEYFLRYAAEDKEFVKEQLAMYKSRLLPFVITNILDANERFYTPSNQSVIG